MRFQYRHPRFYNFFISFLYPKVLRDRIAELVGNHKTVLEVAAGYGRVAQFLHPSVQYRGIDLNPYFIAFAKKQGRRVVSGDILDKNSYSRSDVLLCDDIVHHLTKPQLRQLFDLVFTHATEKVLVIEPSFVNRAEKYGWFGAAIDKFLIWIDNDGINTIDRWFSPAEYKELFNSRFGSEAGKDFSFQYEKLANHHVVLFTRDASA